MLAVAIGVVATAWPWFTAQGVNGTAAMAGWGGWTTTGVLDASLRPLPLAVLAYVAVVTMLVGAWRALFGVCVIGAMTAFAAGVLPYLVMPATTRVAPGSEAVGIAVATGPGLLVAVSVVATIVCWIGYARCVLRAAPRAAARPPGA